MNQVFELAPSSRLHDWDKALAFALGPSAGAFAAIYFFAGHATLAAVVSGVCFAGIMICAFALASTPLGRISLSEHSLLLESGFIHAQVPLAELDLASARVGEDDGASLRFWTKPANAITLPRRDGPALIITPLDIDGFLAAIRARKNAA